MNADSAPLQAADVPQPRLFTGSVVQVVGIACAAGVISGGLHGLSIWVQRFGLGRLTFHSRDAIWMAPLGAAITFGALALVAALIAVLFRRRIPAVAAVALFGFLGAFSALLPYGGIARWAAAVFSFGVAAQLVRASRVAPGRFVRRLTRVGIRVTLVVAVLGIGQRAVMAASGTLRQRALPTAPTDAPNILLIVFDAVRRDNLSLYGYPRPTSPALEKWAARGVVFDNAIATAPWTLPSHGSLFTGALPQHVGGHWARPISDSLPTIAEVLANRGYRTVGIAANLLYASYEGGLARGFHDFRDYPMGLGQILAHSPLGQTGFAQSLRNARSFAEVTRAVLEFNLDIDPIPFYEVIPAKEITDEFLLWQKRGSDRPFFAFLNYFDAHDPYRSTPEYATRFAATGEKRDRYDAAIANLDAELDRLLRTLEDRGVLGRTIVVVTSDHGEFFGEHDLHGHATGLYLPVLRVPLAIIGPSPIVPGTRVEEPVSLRDVPATVLDMLNHADPGVSGSSLVGLWDQSRRGNPPSIVISHVIAGDVPTATNPNARTWLESVVDGQHHYIRSGLGLEELYAWRTDSLEQHNLAATPAGKEVILRLRAHLPAVPRRD